MQPLLKIIYICKIESSVQCVKSVVITYINVCYNIAVFGKCCYQDQVEFFVVVGK